MSDFNMPLPRKGVPPTFRPRGTKLRAANAIPPSNSTLSSATKAVSSSGQEEALLLREVETYRVRLESQKKGLVYLKSILKKKETCIETMTKDYGLLEESHKNTLKKVGKLEEQVGGLRSELGKKESRIEELEKQLAAMKTATPKVEAAREEDFVCVDANFKQDGEWEVVQE